MYKLIIWDWNGTLLDDAEVCIKAMNPLLKARKLKELDKERYAGLFTFPVKDYYSLLGFELHREDFSIPAMEFMDHYIRMVSEAGLRKGFPDVISLWHRQGIKQVILSAMEQNLLTKLVREHGLSSYMDGLFGISDHFGTGKKEAAAALMESYRIQPDEMVLIGDTIHDIDVAESIGCTCFVIPGGHQSVARLKKEAAGRQNVKLIERPEQLIEAVSQRNIPLV